MDKNTILGFLLILVVLFGFQYFNKPSEEQLAQQRAYQDSIALVRQAERAAQDAAAVEMRPVATEESSDSARHAGLQAKFGSFAAASEGDEQLITLENELIAIKLSTKGGRIYSVNLKEYSDYNDEPLYLFDGDESSFDVTFITASNLILNSRDFYFEPIKNAPDRLTMRLHAEGNSSLDFVYTLHEDDYIVEFNIIPVNMKGVLSPAMRDMEIFWSQKIRQQERGRKFEERYARLTYKFPSDDVEQLRESKDDEKNISNKLKWIGYKDQFFSSVLIANETFSSTKLTSHYITSGKYMKEYSTRTSVPFTAQMTEGANFNYYFGPNDYPLLKKYDKTKFSGQDLELEKLVPLGWSLFRYVNKWVIIPIFDWLTSWTGSLGLAIFLLTLIVKIVLFPLNYKSLMSSTKMRVLRPQIQAINDKYPGQDNAMNRQQKVMELYKKYGVSPMAGCMPMLIQMPILLALFMFFPSAIELRHESFLWATDLSTFDDVIKWNVQIPFISKWFGNHISIFCLLMTVTNIIYTKFNMDQQAGGQEQMPGMKAMMYFMPVMMLFVLNSYPAGLNYYYFISTLITILQTVGFRVFTNEAKLLAKMEDNKKKLKNNPKKKSSFMERLEEAQRQQQALLKEQQKKNKR